MLTLWIYPFCARQGFRNHSARRDVALWHNASFAAPQHSSSLLEQQRTNKVSEPDVRQQRLTHRHRESDAFDPSETFPMPWLLTAYYLRHNKCGLGFKTQLAPVHAGNSNA